MSGQQGYSRHQPFRADGGRGKPVSRLAQAVRRSVEGIGPSVLAVVGEHRGDPTRLLLRGDDGAFYTYDDDHDGPISVELNADWIVDLSSAHAA